MLRNTANKSSKIGKGWKDFCIFNRLEERDILVFLVDKEMKKEDQSLHPQRMQFLILHFFFSLLFILCMVF